MATMAFGEHTIRIDCDVLQADGGTRTASITGGCVALADACAWLASGPGPSPFGQLVAAVSVGVVEGEERLDLAYLEDRDAQVDANVVMLEPGPVRGGAGHRRARHLHPGPARHPARSGGARHRPALPGPAAGARLVKLLVATRSGGKQREIGRVLEPPAWRCLSRRCRAVGAARRGRPGAGRHLRGQRAPQGRVLRPAERPAHRRRRLGARGVRPRRRARACARGAGPGRPAPPPRWTRPTTPSCCAGCPARPRRGAGPAIAACWSSAEPGRYPRSSRARAADGSSRRRAGAGVRLRSVLLQRRAGRTFGEATPEERTR